MQRKAAVIDTQILSKTDRKQSDHFQFNQHQISISKELRFILK